MSMQLIKFTYIYLYNIYYFVTLVSSSCYAACVYGNEFRIHLFSRLLQMIGSTSKNPIGYCTPKIEENLALGRINFDNTL
jgi:hypothetical protein